MDKLVFDKGLILPDKLICLSKTCVSNAWESPRGLLMPSPQDHDKIANAPPPGLTTWANAPRLPNYRGVIYTLLGNKIIKSLRGGGDSHVHGHRWNWLMHKNIIKQLLCIISNYWIRLSYDMKNSADLGGCYPPQHSASVDNTLLDLQNSSYPRFWLVKTTCIIHHNQLLFTKFGKNLRHIESMTSKVQPAENYWTDDGKSAAHWRLLNR